MIRAAILALLLSGCTTLSHLPPPADWPTLEVRKHYVSQIEMRDQCVRYAPWYQWPTMACSIINFVAKTCDQWFDKDRVTADEEEHEDGHCRGMDHAGGTYLADLWRAYSQRLRGGTGWGFQSTQQNASLGDSAWKSKQTQ